MKKIIISGTSRGIGLELVKILAQMGHSVLALSRNTAPTLQIKNVTSLAVDISKETDIQKVKKFIKDEWNEVDVLINNAGKLVNKPFENLTSEDFLQVYQVNVFGVAQLIQVVLPFLKKGSNILNISSMGGIQGSVKFPGLAAYSSSKGALITLTEVLAQEFQSREIICNVLALGAVQTEMLQEAFPDYTAPTSPEQMASYIADFVLHTYKFFNGKTIQVANSTP